MIKILCNAVAIGLSIYAANLLVALFSGTIFSVYFNAKKKYMRELNGLDQIDGE